MAGASAWAQRLGDAVWETWTCGMGWTVEGLHGPDGATAGGPKLPRRSGVAERAEGSGAPAGKRRGPGQPSSAVMMVDCYGEGRRDRMWVRDLAVAADSDGRVRLARAPVLRGAQAWQAGLLPEMRGGRSGGGWQAGLRFSCDGKRVFGVVGERVRVFAVVESGDVRHADPAIRAQRRAASLASEAEREVRVLGAWCDAGGG